jgi:hypothetical protein
MASNPTTVEPAASLLRCDVTDSEERSKTFLPVAAEFHSERILWAPGFPPSNKGYCNRSGGCCKINSTNLTHAR